ncbi:MAG: hypothetical protein ACLR6I_11545 [Waltera sp.]
MDAINHRRQEQLVGHIGVSNVDTIIRLTYGEEYGIHMESLTSNAENPTDGQRTVRKAEVHGTKVTLRLPVKIRRSLKGSRIQSNGQRVNSDRIDEKEYTERHGMK